MSAPRLFGLEISNYVRTARMALEEKGVEYELVAIGEGSLESIVAELSSPQYRARHPWAKMPALEHGDVVIFESMSIARYVDEAFDGPSLQPGDAAGRALMEAWISGLLCYGVPALMAYSFKYFFPSGPDGALDREAIDGTLADLERNVEILNNRLSDTDWLAGDAFSLADSLCLPALSYAGLFPEGKELLASRPALGAYLARGAERPSFIRTQPELPGGSEEQRKAS